MSQACEPAALAPIPPDTLRLRGDRPETAALAGHLRTALESHGVIARAPARR